MDYKRLTIKNYCFCDICQCIESKDVCNAGKLKKGICDERAIYEQLRKLENKIEEGEITFNE